MLVLWYIGSCSAAADTWIQRGLSSQVEDGVAQEYWFSYDNEGESDFPHDTMSINGYFSFHPSL